MEGPKTCPKCGKRMMPTLNQESGEFLLEWLCDCGECILEEATSGYVPADAVSAAGSDGGEKP